MSRTDAPHTRTIRYDVRGKRLHRAAPSRMDPRMGRLPAARDSGAAERVALLHRPELPRRLMARLINRDDLPLTADATDLTWV